MKKIDVGRTVKDFKGEEIPNPNDENSPPLTILTVIENNIARTQSKDGDKAKKVFKLGMKVMSKDFDGHVEDAEHELIMELVKENPWGYFDLPRGQALLYLEGLEDVKLPKKDKKD